MIKNAIQSWDGHSAAEKEEYIKRSLRRIEHVEKLIGDISKDAPEALDTLKEIADTIKAVPVEAGSGQNSNQQKGTGAVASGKNSFATGNSTTASGNNSVSEGHSTIASGAASHAEGKETVASGQRSHAEGEQTLAGQKAYRYTGFSWQSDNGLRFSEKPVGFTVGDVVSIINDKKYADCATITDIYFDDSGNWTVEFDSRLPFDTIVPDSDFDKHLIYVSAKPDVGDIDLGRFAHAEGWGSKAQNVAAHAEGRDTKAFGEYSHAEGRNTLAQYAAHAEGKDTQALGERSHAEGHQSMASGGNAHAEGSTTTASGDNSHAEGASSVAGGDNSHAEGSETVTRNVAEHAEGKYNRSNKASDTFGDSGNTLHSVGIGAAEHLRKNAFEIMQNGDAYLLGVGGYDGTNPGEAKSIREAISVNSEHVIVKIRGCEWDATNSTDKSASVTGGKVIVKAFNPATAENLPVQEYAIPAPAAGEKASIVELDIQHGLHYQIHSEVDGLGASFRLVFTSSLENRTVYLWNCSLGVYNFGFNALLSNDDDSFQRMVPVIHPDGSADLSEFMDWDTDDSVYSDDGGYFSGVLLSTVESSFLLQRNYKSAENLAWSKMNYGRNVPGLEEFYETAEHDNSAAQELAKADFDGALNSDKILTALSEAPAALFAAQAYDYLAQRYLPAAGGLYLIWQNKAAINAIIAVVDDSSLPQIDNSFGYCWSSSTWSPLDSWRVTMDDGNVSNGNKRNMYGVLGVSAFHFNY